MKKIFFNLFLVGLLVTAIGLLNTSMAQAKPTVLYIYGQYCGACRQFEPTYDSAKAKFSQKFNFEKEEYDSSQKARELHVTETPSVYILDGSKVQKIGWECLSSPGCLEERLQSY